MYPYKAILSPLSPPHMILEKTLALRSPRMHPKPGDEPNMDSRE